MRFRWSREFFCRRGRRGRELLSRHRWRSGELLCRRRGEGLPSFRWSRDLLRWRRWCLLWCRELLCWRRGLGWSCFWWSNELLCRKWGGRRPICRWCRDVLCWRSWSWWRFSRERRCPCCRQLRFRGTATSSLRGFQISTGRRGSAEQKPGSNRPQVEAAPHIPHRARLLIFGLPQATARRRTTAAVTSAGRKCIPARQQKRQCRSFQWRQ